jgi:hypothetical protein
LSPGLGIRGKSWRVQKDKYSCASFLEAEEMVRMWSKNLTANPFARRAWRKVIGLKNSGLFTLMTSCKKTIFLIFSQDGRKGNKGGVPVCR